VIVGTVGAGVPEEVLVAAAVDVVPIEGQPGESTDLADRYVEPLVGERARSQLTRLLDGTYVGLDLLVCSREEEAPLRLFYTLRELRRLEPDRELPPVHLVDLQHSGTAATRQWNEARVRDLCALLGVREDWLSEAIRQCNARRARDGGVESGLRVYVAGSEHRETRLARAVAATGATVVAPRAILTAEDGDPVAAVARRYEHPLLAGARASSSERANAIAEDAAAVGADVVIAFYVEGEDGLRWEYPELRAALEALGIRSVLLDQQPYDLVEVELDV
jgi:hypothetical protein